jgi:hypothetical protein
LLLPTAALLSVAVPLMGAAAAAAEAAEASMSAVVLPVFFAPVCLAKVPVLALVLSAVGPRAGHWPPPELGLALELPVEEVLLRKTAARAAGTALAGLGRRLCLAAEVLPGLLLPGLVGSIVMLL